MASPDAPRVWTSKRQRKKNLDGQRINKLHNIALDGKPKKLSSLWNPPSECGQASGRGKKTLTVKESTNYIALDGKPRKLSYLINIG